MYQVTKKFHFSAAHSLPALPPEHKCHRLHGHNYEVEICVSSEELNAVGMVIEFEILSDVMDPLVAALDHRNLNDFMSFPTTAENVARYFFLACEYKFDPCRERLEWVSVSETPKSIPELLQCP